MNEPQRNHGRNGLLARWSRFAARRRWSVLLGWVAVLAVLGALALTYSGRFVDSFEIPGAESQQAVDLLEERFPDRAGDSATLVFEDEAGINEEQTRSRIEDIVSEAGDRPGVSTVSSPFDTPGAISEDGTIAYATVQYDEPAAEVDDGSVDELLELTEEPGEDGLRVEAGGQVVSQSEISPPGESELIGLAAAVVILLVAFGSVIAMGLPVVTALVGLASGFTVIALAANLTDMSTFTPAFASMVGIGVGIDYALFVVTRYREELSEGLNVEEAIAAAVDTSGRAVIAAGTVVVIALLGLATIGIPFVFALGLAAAIVVALAVLVAVTLLPALLGFAGRAIDRWKIPALRSRERREGGGHRESFSYRFSRRIQRHPWAYAALAVAFLVLLTAPVLDLRLGFSDDGSKPASYDSRQAYDLLEEGFGPGLSGPFVITVEAEEGLRRSTLERVSSELGETNGVERATPAVPNEDGDAAVVTVYPDSSPQSERTQELVDRLREDTLPEALEGTGAEAYVGGATASFADIGDRIGERMPYFFAFVIGLSFVLLMAVFRSVAIPIKAAIMNLLSIGAAYGVLVPIFQWGWLNGLLGIPATGPIEAFLPMMLFAILFGLSMDYEVFLVSRIRESYLKTGDPRGSVADGLSITARVITAAAAIMVSVFLSFVAADDRIIKEFGIGLAVGILVDATVIRLVLVPATMTILGRWNWSFPRWLDAAVPSLNIEGESTPPTTPQPSRDLIVSGIALEYLARRIETADGEYPRLIYVASSLLPEDGSTRHERARQAANEVLRPLAVQALLTGGTNWSRQTLQEAAHSAPGGNGVGSSGTGRNGAANDDTR